MEKPSVEIVDRDFDKENEDTNGRLFEAVEREGEGGAEERGDDV